MPKTPGARAGTQPDALPPNAASLARAIEDYLAANPAPHILEDGRILFDLRTARCSVTESHGRCQLQLWRVDRNLARTVVGVEPRAARSV